MKKILLAIFLIVGVLAVSVGYVLFSQPAPEGNGSKTVYDYERLEPFPFDIQDGEMRDTVGCLRRLHSDTRYLVRLRFRVTGSPLITLEIVDSSGHSVYSNTAVSASSPEFEFGPFPDGDYEMTFRASTAFIGASGFEENAEFFEKFPSEDGITDWID